MYIYVYTYIYIHIYIYICIYIVRNALLLTADVDELLLEPSAHPKSVYMSILTMLPYTNEQENAEEEARYIYTSFTLYNMITYIYNIYVHTDMRVKG